jgi:hypothetical protein
MNHPASDNNTVIPLQTLQPLHNTVTISCHIVMESNLFTSLYLLYVWLTILCWDCNEG